ncbi:heparinase II/III family protein, partial [bacterium]|nr:heparinase II/III family protein [bacterium]
EKILNLISQKYPDTIEKTIKAANEICEHKIDLLGLGKVDLGKEINWHKDFKSNKVWQLKYYTKIDYMNLDEPSDVKVPWELSRFHHLVTLGKAYWYTGDEKYAEEFTRQIKDWIKKNPIRSGINWVISMEVAIRLINWIWAYYFFVDSPSFTEELRVEFFKSLFLHGEHIINNLEIYQLNDNHYITDGVGLLYLGILFPEFKKAEKWKAKGMEIVFEEIEKQVYSDGVDYEKSISYHRFVLELLTHSVILCHLNKISVPTDVLKKLEEMIEFTMYYIKPDGKAPLIGDSDDGRLLKLNQQDVNDHKANLSTGAVLFPRVDFKANAGKFYEESFWLLGEEGLNKFNQLSTTNSKLSSKSFPDGGFYIMRESDSYMFIDCGDSGMYGHGGHGHNDTLSFELFAKDKTFISDRGSYVYTASPYWRFHFKSTKSHNTVTVDGEEIARFNGFWGLKNDAKVKVNRWISNENYDFFDGEHKGYERLKNPVNHRRQIYFDKEGRCWIIKDILTGKGKHKLDLYFHLNHIETIVNNEDSMAVKSNIVDGANILVLPVQTEGLEVKIEDGWISYKYGEKIEAPVVRYSKDTELPTSFFMVLYPFDGIKPKYSFKDIKLKALKIWNEKIIDKD